MNLKLKTLALLMLIGCGNAHSGSTSPIASSSTTEQAAENSAPQATDMASANANRPERDAYSFKVTTDLDDAGAYVDSIYVEGWANGKLTDFRYGHALWVEQLTTKTDWLREDDINFDGYPDLLVFHGYVGYGGQGGDVYEAFVWDADKRAFVYVDEFNSLPDPTCDDESKTITIAYRDGAESVVHATYRVNGNQLEEINYECEEFEQ